MTFRIVRTMIQALLTIAAATAVAVAQSATDSPATPPNVVLIVADDLGYGELGVYGQEKIKTPHIDRMAADGVRFTDFYAGAPVCAPSRCVLLTGKHSGHAAIRDNVEVSTEGQMPLPSGTFTIGHELNTDGFAVAAIGKWGLGGSASSGEPTRMGFDHFYGHLCQRRAHYHFPAWLWRDTMRETLKDNVINSATGKLYANDLFLEEAKNFITKNRERPFFLYYASPLPHLGLQVKDEDLSVYKDAFPETPYDGKRGYTAHPTPRAAYAAMITRLDKEVGSIIEHLKMHGLDERTIVIFTSDNGPTHDVGGVDTEFFKSAGALRGRKGSVYEGGLRVPLIVRSPKTVPAGKVISTPAAMQDLAPTIIEFAGGKPLKGADGKSLLPILTGKSTETAERELYWEFPGYGAQQAVRFGSIKALRRDMAKGNAKLEIYDLAKDIGETKDLAAERPELVEKALAIMQREHTPNASFKLPIVDVRPPSPSK